MSETLSEILSALNDLINEIEDWKLEHDDYLYPDSDEKLVARRDDIRERLVACGDAAIEPLEEYLYATKTHAYIITVDVLAEIGSPAAIQRLVDAVELGHNQLPPYAARALAKIGAGSVQPLIERITDQLDNPVVDEKGDEADITNMVDALSGIVDPRSFDFMAELLDRFEGKGRFEDLAHLCSRFYDQHNPEIIPRMRALVEEYDDCDDSSAQVAVDARDTSRRLEVDRAIDSEDWIIYGCCNICRDYDHYAEWCRAFEEYKPFDHFCLECEPVVDFRCDVCHLKRVLLAPDDSDSDESSGIATDSCNIDNMPAVYANLRYHLEQEEFSDRFKITANYNDVGGLIIITNDRGIEFCFWYDTLDDLDALRDFFRGKIGHFPGEMRFFINCGELLGKPDLYVDGESGKAIRNDCGVATAVYESDRFGLELAFDQEAIDVLVAIIDTQRFLLLCDSYTRIDEFYDNREQLVSTIRSLKESGELHVSAEASAIGEPQPCDHEFELLKTHKKYTVYQCTRCGETKKEFN